MREREQVNPAGIAIPPAELLDKEHPTWRDPEAFARWCDRNGFPGITEKTGEFPTTHFVRFGCGRSWWTEAHGIGNDRDSLAAVGIPFSGALDRARALSEVLRDRS